MRTVHEDSTASSFYTFSQSVPIMDGMSGWKGAVWKIDLAAFFQLAQEVAPFLPPGFGLIGPQHLPGIPLAKNRAPFHTVSASSHGPRPLVGVHRVRRQEPQRIIMHAGGLAKNRAPFHLATLALNHLPGLQQAGGRVYQGIARHGRLAKDRAPYLIR